MNTTPQAKTLYTWNTKDFLWLPPAIAGRVRNPINNRWLPATQPYPTSCLFP